MTERDPSSAGPRPEPTPQPHPQWESDTTPGVHAAGRDPHAATAGHPGTAAPGAGAWSGTGASAVGAGWAGGSGTGYSSDSGYGYGSDSGDTRTYPRHGQHEQVDDGDRHTAPEYSTAPVRVRRPDVLAGLLLLLAGIAAGISLLLDWASGIRGWDFVEDGLRDFDTGSWQPPVTVLAGGVLLVLGLLVLLPARTHRTLGVLALLASIAALVAVVVVLNESRWTWDFFEVGFWVAAAVPVLGLLGSLKAMLTGPRER
ncbi:hypothetical protein [Blastococcus sp. TF02A-26]|uniref:hypothetical protein n=1 Tax=Blastococcus sp. TF02A-26 TaxID=2250577 RepID=UPI0018F57043|nr:hypothetical protein [Blastococcus sp. TF02A-26]